jgi:hypothetical protein
MSYRKERNLEMAFLNSFYGNLPRRYQVTTCAPCCIPTQVGFGGRIDIHIVFMQLLSAVEEFHSSLTLFTFCFCIFGLSFRRLCVRHFITSLEETPPFPRFNEWHTGATY